MRRLTCLTALGALSAAPLTAVAEPSAAIDDGEAPLATAAADEAEAVEPVEVVVTGSRKYEDPFLSDRSVAVVSRKELSEAQRDIAGLREAALRLERKMTGTSASRVACGAHAPCSQCGSSHLTRGKIRGQVAFVAHDARWLDNLAPSWGFAF